MNLQINKIHKMDCFEGLKQLENESVDFVVTSPPYNKQMVGGGIVKKIDYDIYKDDISEEEYQVQQINLLNELSRILKPGGHIFYNHKNRYSEGKFISPLYWIKESKLNIRQEIIWNRKISANLRGWRFWNCDERIYWLQRPDAEAKEIPSEVASKSSIWSIMPQRGNGHPCAFPEELVENCLSIENAKGKLVLDPYMGSGTTAVVAKYLGMNFIGFELSDTYLEIAEERLGLEQRRPDKQFQTEFF